MKRVLIALLLLLASPALADDTVHFVAPMPDGSVAVVVGADKAAWFEDKCTPIFAEPDGVKGLDRQIDCIWTDQEYADWVKAESRECQQAECEQMPDDWFPPFDRRLRNAWEKLPDVAQAGNFTDMGEPMRGIGINMAKAKGLWRAQMERAALAEAQDQDDEIRKADLNGDNQGKAAAQQKRNALNGIMNRNQAAIDAATTPEQLMAIWPTELESRRPKAPDTADVTKRRDERKAKAKNANGAQ